MTREEVLNIVGICVCMARVDLEFSQDEKHLLQELCKNINVSDKEKAQIKNISGSLSEMVHRVEEEDSKKTLVELLSQVAVTDGFVDDVEENLLVKVMSHCGVDSSTHPYFGDDGLIDAEVVSEDHNNVMDRLKEWASSHPPA